MPDTVSWSWLESSAWPTCTARLFACIARPNARAIRMKSGYGSRTKRASQGSRVNMAPKVATKRIGFWITERSPGPSRSRTAVRSFTQRLMRSPVRQWK